MFEKVRTTLGKAAHCMSSRTNSNLVADFLPVHSPGRRAWRYIYVTEDEGAEQRKVVLDEAGDVGKYNRANRSRRAGPALTVTIH